MRQTTDVGNLVAYSDVKDKFDGYCDDLLMVVKFMSILKLLSLEFKIVIS